VGSKAAPAKDSLKREREETYSSSSAGDGDEHKEKDNLSDSSTDLTPLYSQSLPEHGGKLLIKNCFVWQWNEDGCGSQEERTISGQLLPLRYLSVDHYGRISKLLTASQEAINESLYETVIEARHRVILPGLMDAHIHVMHTGESAYYVDLSDCNSIKELQDAVRSHHEKNPHLPWIMGTNWDQVGPVLTPSSPYPPSSRFLDKPVSTPNQIRSGRGRTLHSCLPLESLLAHRSCQHFRPSEGRNRPISHFLRHPRGRDSSKPFRPHR
jgi:hypothetical protein